MISESVFLFRDDSKVRRRVLGGGRVSGPRDRMKKGMTGTGR